MKPGSILHGHAKEGTRMEISKDKLLWMYERMQLIRTFENRGQSRIRQGENSRICTPVCWRGSGCSRYLRSPHDADYMTSTHRGHGHCIAKALSHAA